MKGSPNWACFYLAGSFYTYLAFPPELLLAFSYSLNFCLRCIQRRFCNRMRICTMEFSWECCSWDPLFPDLSAAISAWRQKVSFGLSQVYIPSRMMSSIHVQGALADLEGLEPVGNPGTLKVAEYLGVMVVGDIASNELSQSLTNYKPLSNWK